MALLTLDSLTVTVTNNRGVFPVIADLSFELEEGKVLGLVGESGAGKSMIGRTIAQLLPNGFAVAGGKLTFDGQDMVAMDPDRRRAMFGRDIAFIPQEPLSALNPVLTIGQQMREHLDHAGVEGDWREQTIRAFEAVHLNAPETLLSKYPHQLSGGMCQRILIAMAFVSKPKLLIADEPTTALDVTIQARIVDLIKEMQQASNTAVIFITHDLRLANQICDDVLVLYAGRQAEYGPAREVFSHPAHPYTRCLQLAIPTMGAERRGLFILPERMPGLQAIKDLKGCRFASRCPLALPVCHEQEPDLHQAGQGHVALCVRPEDTPTIAAPPPPEHATDLGPIVLKGEKLSKAYITKWRLFGKPDTFKAVRDVDFMLRDGEFVGIVGESGSGKSSLARLMVGLETPTGGRMELLGRALDGKRPDEAEFRRKSMQIVFQDPQSALNPRRKVGTIVTQAYEADQPPENAPHRATRAAELLRDIGLSPEMATRYPSQLSGGQKQRINIARAMCTVPRVLVADEIVSGLDVSVQAQLLDLLLRLRRERGFSMMIISHDLSVVRYLCDRVMVMYKGEVVETGATEEVFANPRHDYTRTLLASCPPDELSADGRLVRA